MRNHAIRPRSAGCVELRPAQTFPAARDQSSARGFAQSLLVHSRRPEGRAGRVQDLSMGTARHAAQHQKNDDRRAYGYSIPVFPTHTPVNFATLMTGSLPKTHGVADGPMRLAGSPLSTVALSGFSSLAKSSPIWKILEDRFITETVSNVKSIF